MMTPDKALEAARVAYRRAQAVKRDSQKGYQHFWAAHAAECDAFDALMAAREAAEAAQAREATQ